MPHLKCHSEDKNKLNVWYKLRVECSRGLRKSCGSRQKISNLKLASSLNRFLLLLLYCAWEDASLQESCDCDIPGGNRSVLQQF